MPKSSTYPKTFAPMVAAAQVLQRGELQVDLKQHIITVAGKKLKLSATEFELLAHLARVAPEIVSPQELASQVQGYEIKSLQDANATLRYHFYRLRRKIKQATGRDDLIQTIYGVGYGLYQRPESESPAGAITFLFTDIQSSTELWEQFPHEMKGALARHDALMQENITHYGGYVFKRVGDAFCAVFSSPFDAVIAALHAQRALHAERWATPTPLQVRMALNTGPAESRDGDYFGTTLNHVGRLIAVGHGGQILVAQATQEQIATRLPLNVELHDMGLRRLKGIKDLTRIFQLVASDLPAQFPPLKTLDPPRNNLPGQLSSFIGRETQVRQVSALLRRPDVRLVTLTGAGGTGKTRLSVEIASSLLDEYQDGVFFVSLAAVQESTRVPSMIARALWLVETESQTVMERLGDYLRERQVLLVLDNLEHLLDAAPDVTELLRMAPHLKVLVTSREALVVYGEHQFTVPSLTLPDARTHLTLAQLDVYEAPKLFIERARAILPRLALTDADAAIISEICACLDGLPLAIELAAARVPQFRLTELAAQLTSRLKFLASGPRDLPARHRTLRALFDWSYHLLTASEQALFARLAVFVGGWTFEAANAVATWQGDASGAQGNDLDSLAAKSLIQPIHETRAQPRFTMLETLREYARAHLETGADLETVRQNHAAYYLQELERAEPELNGGPHQKDALAMCAREQENFRAALQWALEQKKIETALRIVNALWRFWAIESHLLEGRNWLEQVLVQSETAPAGLRAGAWYGLGKLSLFQNNLPNAQRASETALALYTEVADQDGIAWSQNALGEIAAGRDDMASAKSFFDAGLALHRERANKIGIAKATDDLGRLALGEGDYVRAAQLFEASLQLRRERGSPEGIAVGLLALGEALRLQGDFARAETVTRESLAHYRALNHNAGMITSLDNLAHMRLAQQDASQALALFIEELGMLRELEHEELELARECLSGLALALNELDESFQAAQIVGAYERLTNSHASAENAPATESDPHEAIRARLGQAEWERGRAEGRGMTLDEIVSALVSRPQEFVKV